VRRTVLTKSTIAKSALLPRPSGAPPLAPHLHPLMCTGARGPASKPLASGAVPVSGQSALHTPVEHVPSSPHEESHATSSAVAAHAPSAPHATQSRSDPSPHGVSQHTPSTHTPDSQRSWMLHGVPTASGSGKTATRPVDVVL
jgi:hypothetical protein